MIAEVLGWGLTPQIVTQHETCTKRTTQGRRRQFVVLTDILRHGVRFVADFFTRWGVSPDERARGMGVGAIKALTEPY